jgi:nicotinate-nucleotide adenylyltransferase
MPGLTRSARPGIARVMAELRKIALFGGTFDPVHVGHVHLAETARDQFGLDELRFIPCRISPHKQETIPASAEDRLEMLRLATEGLPWAVVDDFELQREGPSYSWQTAKAMAERFPEARMFWIMGGDQWDALSKWEHPERLADCVEFIVFTRGKELKHRDGFVLHALEGGHPASATVIREACARGEMKHRWLTPAVSRWISEHHLYQTAQ